MAVDLPGLYKLYSRLTTELATWLTLWQEIGDFMVPWRNMILNKTTPGTKLTDRIFDSTAPQALTTAASAVHSSVTPDSLRWFSFTLSDPELLKAEGVLPWLDDTANRVWRALSTSNFNSEAQELYSDLLAFGTGMMVVEEEPLRNGLKFAGLRFHTQQPGSFVIAEGPDGRVDTAIRELPMRAGAMVRRWGLDKVSEATQKAIEAGHTESMRRVLHLVYPRQNGRNKALAPKGRPIASVWAEVIGIDGLAAATGSAASGPTGSLHLLEEKGMNIMPVLAPRWRKISGETYGRSPGMDVLPDVRTLNQAVELRLKAWTLAVAPPIITTDRGVVGDIRLRPFGRIYVKPGATVTTLDIPSRFDVANFSEERLQSSIKAGLFVDLLQFPSKAGTPISATEASIRFQTMQKILGPVAARLQPDFLVPLIQRSLGLMVDAGGIAPAPPALAGTNAGLELIFEGPLSRVQLTATVEAINQFMALITPIGQVLPEVFTRVDADNLVEELEKATSVPASIIRSVEAATEIRKEKAAAAQQQSVIANMVEGSKAAKNLQGVFQPQPGGQQ